MFGFGFSDFMFWTKFKQQVFIPDTSVFDIFVFSGGMHPWFTQTFLQTDNNTVVKLKN